MKLIRRNILPRLLFGYSPVIHLDRLGIHAWQWVFADASDHLTISMTTLPISSTYIEYLLYISTNTQDQSGHVFDPTEWLYVSSTT